MVTYHKIRLLWQSICYEGVITRYCHSVDICTSKVSSVGTRQLKINKCIYPTNPIHLLQGWVIVIYFCHFCTTGFVSSVRLVYWLPYIQGFVLAPQICKFPSAKVYQPGPEVIKLFSCSTHLSIKFFLLINLKLLTTENSFLLNIAERENFSANKHENANYCWVEHEKSFITSGPGLPLPDNWAATSGNVSSDMCAMRRFWSTCAFAQSDQIHRWARFGFPFYFQSVRITFFPHKWR